MFNSHTAKASVGEADIKRALELLAKDKGMPFEIVVTKFWYKKGSIKFAYDVKPKTEEAGVKTCSKCGKRRPCKTEYGVSVCDLCESEIKAITS